MPGDLVMAFASDIHHPALESGLIHPNYMVIGLVKAFIEVKWDTEMGDDEWDGICLLYTSPSPRDATLSRMPSSA